MEIHNKKILVTGGAGFIGSHTVDALIKRGASVIIVDNFLTGRKENLNSKAKFYKLNIADPQVEKIFKKEKPDIVYHFAFDGRISESVKNPLIVMDSIIGSINIFQNAIKYRVEKVIFFSSGVVYGDTQILPISEIQPMNPISPYGVAKSTVENYLKVFNKFYGLNYVIFRYSVVYGPRQVIGAMADYIRKIAVDRQAEIYGDGTMTRDYVYIEDVVRANLLALEISEKYLEPVFNISTAIETTLNDLYGKIGEILNKKAEPIYLPGRLGEQKRYILDNLKAKKILGWQPEITLKESLRKRIDIYKKYKI